MPFRTLRARKRVLAGALTPLVLVVGLSSDAASLPDQASPVGEEHAHTHGPDGLDLYRPGRGPRPEAPAASFDADATAPWSSADYDGVANPTDAADLTTLPTIHFVYVYPKDRASRFTRFAAMFQADARDASALLTSLYGRGFRLDERRRSGDPTRTVVDITVVQSRYRANQLAGANQFSLVADELRAKGFTNSNKKYAAWLDAGSQYCGQGELYQDTRRSSVNSNERRTTAIVYRPYDQNNADGGFCRGRTLRHELGHNLGALQQVAPSAFDGAHCDDSAEDTMCYTSATDGHDWGGPEFDHGNDDYWDPIANPNGGSPSRLPWWTVNLSKFVCPTTGCTYASTPEY